jgi:hypothetical protein
MPIHLPFWAKKGSWIEACHKNSGRWQSSGIVWFTCIYWELDTDAVYRIIQDNVADFKLFEEKIVEGLKGKR